MRPEDLLALDLPLFRGIAPAVLSDIALDCHEKRLDPWEILFNQFDTSHDVFFLLFGALMAVYWSPEGREIIYTRFHHGNYFGELSALDDGRRSLAIVAREPSRLLVMSQTSFRAVFDEVPQIRDRVVRDLITRVRTLTARNTELTTYSVEQRVASILIALAVERGRLTAGGVLDNAPTHAEISASIGANREMVSRTMTQLSRKGLLKSARQRIEILDPEALSQLV